MLKFVAAAVTVWGWATATLLSWGAAHNGRAFFWTAAVLAALTAASYVRAVTTAPGTVPMSWRDSPDGGRASPAHPLHGGRRRWCTTCHVWKPARAHHCSVCKQCVLKYDHHCPWIANCVGYYNHKFFLLLVGYATLQFWTCLVGCWGAVWSCLFAPAQARGAGVAVPPPPAYCGSAAAVNNFYGAYLFTAALGVMLAMFAYHHACLALQNVTTVEELDRTGLTYGKSPRQNLIEIFGPLYWTWPLPIQPHVRSDERGVYFERQRPPDLCPLAPPPQRTRLSPDILTSLWAVLPQDDPDTAAPLHHYPPSSCETTPGPQDLAAFARSKSSPAVFGTFTTGDMVPP
eukprot:TRINITY_DN20255_c0_g1_i1.p1 TRINITY_DN20255_c0_g1~~TRINITY_DN20255_c0_g1_i1.p1  ORF type:complete len:345 (+),score=81.83 TRINITY_DN20255_c0_g1_i1:91-1125(+)